MTNTPEFQIHQAVRVRHEERWHPGVVVGKAYDDPRRYNVLIDGQDRPVKDVLAEKIEELSDED